jgi:mannose-6-phosphate isomerase-like protein (cupin superfamily)
MICRSLEDGEEFECAGNLYRMLIPRDDTRCLEAVLETVAPGKATPPNAHASFVQLFVFFSGKGRVHIDGQVSDIQSPGVAFVPMNTTHWVENDGGVPLAYMYVSIWPGRMPADEDLPWREVCARMIAEYAERGFPPQAAREDR